MTDELKPMNCGCGGEARVQRVRTLKSHVLVVMCTKCEIATNYYTNEAEAITAWNRAMGNRMELQTVERTAKVIEHDGVVTMDGRKYHHMEYLCENCKKKVIGGDEYCSHCGCRLDWDEDIPMEYFENGGI